MESRWPEQEEPYRNYLLSTGHATETAHIYAAIGRLFTGWCAEREIAATEASQATLQGFISYCLGRVGRNTVALRLAALRTFFAFLGRPEVAAGLRVRLEQLAPRQAFSPGEVALLFAACRNPRDRAMLTLALHCGLRVSELVGLRGVDLDLDRGLLLVHGKGAKQRWVALNEACVAALDSYRAYSSSKQIDPKQIDPKQIDRDALWLTRDGRPLTRKRAERNLEEIGRRAGVRAHWHRFRTTFATRFLDATHDLEALQFLMGHASPEVTARYTADSRERRALEQMRNMGAGPN